MLCRRVIQPVRHVAIGGDVDCDRGPRGRVREWKRTLAAAGFHANPPTPFKPSKLVQNNEGERGENSVGEIVFDENCNFFVFDLTDKIDCLQGIGYKMYSILGK